MASLQLGLIALIATGSGRVFLRILGLADISESQKTLIGCTLGLGLISLGMLGLACLHALYPWAVFSMLALFWLIGFTEMRALLLSLGANRSLLADRPLMAALILSPLSLAFWMTWLPPHQYDALVYHLPLSEAYMNRHGLGMVHHLFYSYFPQNGEMLFTLALFMKYDILAQMLMWLATALSVWWLFEMGKREAPLSAVLLSCLVLCTHTSVMLLASTVYVEPLLMLWVTAAVLSYFRWRQLNAADARQRSWLVLSALFTGLALGTKYYAGIAAVIIGTFLVFRLILNWREFRRDRAIDLGLYTGIVTILFAPWLIKNALTVGNPFFPFFYRWFPMTGTGWSAETAARYFSILTEYGHQDRFWWDLLTLPLLLLTDNTRFGGGMDILGGLGWDLTFWLLPLGVWACWKNKFLRGLIIFCGLYLAAWFLTGVVLRFLVVLAPILCLLGGCGLYNLLSLLGSRGRAALLGGVAILMATHMLLYLYVAAGVFAGANVLLGLETRDQYLARRLEYYPCARYAAEHLDKNDKILIVGEQRGYYVEQSHMATTVHAPNHYIIWANEAGSPLQFAKKMRQEGFGHILFVPREAQRLGLPASQLDENGLKNWQGLEPDFAKPVFKGPSCALYSIVAEKPKR